MSLTSPASREQLEPGRTGFLFDLDGTLVDSVYQDEVGVRYPEIVDEES